MAPALITTVDLFGIDVGATALAAGAVYGGVKATQGIIQSMQPKISMPGMPKDTKTTATALPQTTEQESMNKKLKASLLTKDWGELKLGNVGLLGY